MGVSAWQITTAELFINAYRRRQREPGIDALPDLEDAPALYLFKQTREMGLHAWNSDPAALVLDRVEAEQVCRAIAALPEDYRVVSALYFMEEFSYQEIAEMVGCPVGTVRSRLHRGRRMLQKALWHLAEQQGIVADLRAARGIGWATGQWRRTCDTLCPGHLADSAL